jgi:hypothetical protein
MAYNCHFLDMPETLQHKYDIKNVKGIHINPRTDDVLVVLKNGTKERWTYTHEGWRKVTS